MKLQDILYERNKTITAKNAGGQDTTVYFEDGMFWWNGQELGKTIPTAKAKLIELTNNAFSKPDGKTPSEIKDENTIEKSIDRHFDKMKKKDGEKFDWLKSVGMTEGMDEERKELDGKIVSKIYKATDYNDHNEAIIILVKALEKDSPTKFQKELAEEYGDKLRAIQFTHEQNGSITEKAQKERNKIFKKVLNLAEATYTNFDLIKKGY